MKIPFQDSRAGENRRWTDYKKLQRMRFLDIYELLESCKELKETELLELNNLIADKLRAFRQFHKGQ